MFKKVNYLHKNDTIGLRKDMITIAKLFGHKKYKFCVWLTYKNFPGKRNTKHPCSTRDITNALNIHIEKTPIYLPRNSTNYLMVNHELLDEYIEKHIKQNRIDKIICKTPIAEQIIKHINRNANTELIEFEPESKYMNITPDKNIYVQLCGAGGFKNQLATITAWYNNKKLLNDKKKKLIITYSYSDDSKEEFHPRTEFRDYIKRKNARPSTLSLGPYELECDRIKNIYIIDKFIPDNAYAYLQAIAYTHVCVSIVEGFGHYIWEPAINGRRVITTDAEPMISVARKACAKYVTDKTISIRNPLRGLTASEKKQINKLIISIPVREEKTIYDTFGKQSWYPKNIPMGKCYFVDEEKLSSIFKCCK